MSSLADHKRRIQEHEEELAGAIDIGAERRPATVGFHTTACAMELLELYLHAANLITTGKTVKHSWFRTPQEGQKQEPLADRKLPVRFPQKDRAYALLYELEERRDRLIYGKAGGEEAEAQIRAFRAFRALLTGLLAERKVTL